MISLFEEKIEDETLNSSKNVCAFAKIYLQYLLSTRRILENSTQMAWDIPLQGKRVYPI